MDYVFSNLLGSPFRGGSLAFHGHTLLCASGNRVRELGLRDASSSTYATQSPDQIQTVAVSPDGSLIATIDVTGRLQLVVRHTRVLLHSLTLKTTPCLAAAFSPDGAFLALSTGKLLQVWHTPAKKKVLPGMHLHRTYGGCADSITSICWSPDSQWLAVSSRDSTSRIFSLDPRPGFVPPTLTGHKGAVVKTFFAGPSTQRKARLAGTLVPHVYSVSADGTLLAFEFTRADLTDPPATKRPPHTHGGAGSASQTKKGRGRGKRKQRRASEEAAVVRADDAPLDFTNGRWRLISRNFFHHPMRLTAADYHPESGLLATAFARGHFLLHALPAFDHIQTLSVSRQLVSSVAFNASGEWLAMGCPDLGQLLVWEWRAEAYVLKQQGHSYDVAAVAFSPDGGLLATGADDAKVKVWAVASGTCFVTFTEHTAPVTALRFSTTNAVFSASRDGTIRAFDLVRYRNFRTFTTPEAVQFCTLELDPAGDILCAGSHDTFQIFLWSVRTAQLLDVLNGHEGPISGLSCSSSSPVVASSSWDRAVKLWNPFDGAGRCSDTLQHAHEVLALQFHPGGRRLATSTLNGELHMWNAEQGELLQSIQVTRDMRGGRLMTDRRAAGNSTVNYAISTLAFSANGALLFAGGDTKWVCVYDAEELVLLRRFQLSSSAAFDGVLDQRSSAKMTDAGPMDLLMLTGGVDGTGDEDVHAPTVAGSVAGAKNLPGVARGQMLPVLRCRAVAVSPDASLWAAATTEGTLIFQRSTGVVFDPEDLDEDITEPSVHRLLGRKEYTAALQVALRLGDGELVRHAVMSVPATTVAGVAAALPEAAVLAVFGALAKELGSTVHVAYVLGWLRALCEVRGAVLRGGKREALVPACRAADKALTALSKHLRPSVERCLYDLAYLEVVHGMNEN